MLNNSAARIRAGEADLGGRRRENGDTYGQMDGEMEHDQTKEKDVETIPSMH